MNLQFFNFQNNSLRNRNTGQSLIELLIAVGISAILLPALAVSLITSREGKAQQLHRQDAILLMREAKEATRSVRERGWNSFAALTLGTGYHPETSGTPATQWNLITGADPNTGVYTRQIVFSSVQRDNNGKIVSSGGTVDPSSKLATITIGWNIPYPSSITSTMYFTRYLDNNNYIQTNKSDFDTGTLSSTATEYTSGSATDGDILLSQTGGFGDWCNPAGPISQQDLSGQGIPNAVSASFYTDVNNSANNRAIVEAAEGGNASGVTLASIKITDPNYANAPVPTVATTFANTPKVKTNGAFNDTSYGYLATDHHGSGGQGIIEDLSKVGSQSNVEVGTLDISSSTNGKSVFVDNTSNRAYLTATDGNLYTFNVATKTGGHSPLVGGTIALSGVGQKLWVVGTKVYVVTNSTTNQLEIVDVTSLGSYSKLDIPLGNSKAGVDLYVTSTGTTPLRAYVVTAVGSPDFFTVDINPADTTWYKQTVAKYATTNGMNPTGVVAVSGSRGIIVGTGSTKNYQVISLSEAYPNPPTLSPCGSGGLTTSYNVNGIATLFALAPASQRAYSYIITDDASHELKIIEGGPGAGNGNYALSGTYYSAPFGPLNTTSAFNNFSANISEPNTTTVAVAVAVADAVGSPATCSPASVTYTYSSDFTGSGSSPTSITGAIPFGSIAPTYVNPGKCFRYRVSLGTSNSTLTPKFYDMSVNYAP